MTAPDRPGDRDQQQAAEVLFGRIPDDHPLTRPDRMRIARVAAALAAARAEEAARWQANVEGVASAFEREAELTESVAWSAKSAQQRAAARRIRAVLGAE